MDIGVVADLLLSHPWKYLPASLCGCPAVKASCSRPWPAVQGSVSSHLPPWISALEQKRSPTGANKQAGFKLAALWLSSCLMKWKNNPFHKVKDVLNCETVCHISPITFGHLLLNRVQFLFLQEIKNLGSCWVPGPFVLRDCLVLFWMLTPSSDIDFCSAFHVSWPGAGCMK